MLRKIVFVVCLLMAPIAAQAETINGLFDGTLLQPSIFNPDPMPGFDGELFAYDGWFSLDQAGGTGTVIFNIHEPPTVPAVVPPSFSVTELPVTVENNQRWISDDSTFSLTLIGGEAGGFDFETLTEQNFQDNIIAVSVAWAPAEFNPNFIPDPEPGEFNNIVTDNTPNVVPEPSSFALPLLLLGCWLRRRFQV